MDICDKENNMYFDSSIFSSSFYFLSNQSTLFVIIKYTCTKATVIRIFSLIWLTYDSHDFNVTSVIDSSLFFLLL